MTVKRTRADAISSGQESKRGPASIFAYKAIATTLVGALLTLGIAIAQISYSNHLEVIRRQGEQGAEFQGRLFEITGHIETELWDIVLRMSRPSGSRGEAGRLRDAVANRVNQSLEPLYRQWRTERFLLRNQGSQIYGREVGRLIYDRSDARLGADGCDVVRRGPGPLMTDCKGPMEQELNRLGAFVAGIARSDNLNAFQTSETSPTSFSANAEIAYTIIHHYLECTEPGGGDPNVLPKPRCRNLPEMVVIARLRAVLVRVARENLANAIMEQSALR